MIRINFSKPSLTTNQSLPAFSEELKAQSRRSCSIRDCFIASLPVMTSIIFFTCLLFFFIACNSEKKFSLSSDIVAQFAEQSISSSELENKIKQEVGEHISSFSEEDLFRLTLQILEQTIENRLILLQAQKLGITLEEQEFADFKKKFQDSLQSDNELSELSDKEQTVSTDQIGSELEKSLQQSLLIEKTIDYVIKPQIFIEDPEIYQYWQENQNEFNQPAYIKAHHILVKTETEAKKILYQLERKASFEELAKKFSIAPEAAQGGDLGYFTIEQMPEEFEPILQNLKEPGQISSILQTPFGWHIFQLDEIKKPSLLSIEEAYPKIIEELRQQKENQAKQEWIAQLKKDYNLEINQEVIKKLVQTMVIKTEKMNNSNHNEDLECGKSDR